MIIEEFLKKGQGLIKWWSVIISIKFFACFFLALLSAYMKPASNTWIMEFLSPIKGIPNEYQINPLTMAYFWTAINSLLVSVDFFVGYRMIKSMLKFTQLKESIFVINMKRQLVAIVVFTIVSFFIQLVSIFACWILELYILFKRYLFFKNLMSINKYLWHISNRSWIFRKLFQKNLQESRSKNLERIMEEQIL